MTSAPAAGDNEADTSGRVPASELIVVEVGAKEQGTCFAGDVEDVEIDLGADNSWPVRVGVVEGADCSSSGAVEGVIGFFGVELEETEEVELGLEYRSWIPWSVLRLIRIELLNLPFTKSEDSKSCEACIPITRHMFK